MNDLKIFKLTCRGWQNEPYEVCMAAHDEDFAIQCYQECCEDKILFVEECMVSDGIIL